MPESDKILLMEVDIENEEYQMTMLDGSKWFVNPGDLPTIATWLPTTELCVTKNEDGFFNINITNTTDDITIRARKMR